MRTVARKIAEWVDRLGAVWVEGQLTQVTARPGTGTAFLVLRDPAADVSLQLTGAVGLVRDGGAGRRRGQPGDRARQAVVLPRPRHAVAARRRDPRGRHRRAAGPHRTAAQAAGRRGPVRPRPQAAACRSCPTASGSSPAARRPPSTTSSPTRRPAGPPCGSGSSTPPCRARWPCRRSSTRSGALDRDPEVDVIVLARGGGSVEDLLPFSDETLCRAVAACRTPVVSAIGHEPDTPLVDHVADVRCSTPTEAGRRVVPDVAEETARIAGLRDRARRALGGWVDREERLLAALRAPAGAGRPAARRSTRTAARGRPAARRPRGAVRRARAGPARGPTRAPRAPGSPRSAPPRRWPGATRSCSASARRPGAPAGAARRPPRRRRARGCGSASPTGRWLRWCELTSHDRTPRRHRPDVRHARLRAGPRRARRGRPDPGGRRPRPDDAWRCGSAARRWPAAARSSSPGPATGCEAVARRTPTTRRARARPPVERSGGRTAPPARGARRAVRNSSSVPLPVITSRTPFDVGDPHRLGAVAP